MVHPFLDLTDGVYRTPDAAASRWGRLAPSLVFYPKFTRIVWRASSLAKRGGYDGYQWSLSSLAVLRALESVGVRFTIAGLEHLGGLDGPCVIAGNHMSTLETGVLPSIIQPIRDVTFVVKQSLIHYPVFKHVMRAVHPIPISQSNPREDLKSMLVEGSERLARGMSLVVFPEASRRPVFNPAEFNSIAVKLAARNDVPLVPLALRTDAWPIGAWISDVGRIDPARPVHFEFGPPMRIAGRGAAEHQAVIDFIQARLTAWGL